MSLLWNMTVLCRTSAASDNHPLNGLLKALPSAAGHHRVQVRRDSSVHLAVTSSGCGGTGWDGFCGLVKGSGREFSRSEKLALGD